MSQTPKMQDVINHAIDALCGLDADIKRAHRDYGYPLERSMSQSYETIAKIIIGQQISRAAATSIWDRLQAAHLTSSDAMAQCTISVLQSNGLSRRKAEYLHGLACAVEQGELVIETLAKMSGQQVQDRLTAMRGIGKWTAENYRLFALGDMDAWPGNDLALQEAMRRLKCLNARPDMKAMEALAKKWTPYRGAGALFLWHLYAIEVRNATPSAI